MSEKCMRTYEDVSILGAGVRYMWDERKARCPADTEKSERDVFAWVCVCGVIPNIPC